MSVSRKVTARVTAERCCDTGIFQRVILRDDRGFEPPKIRPRVDAQLVGEQRPCPLISAQGFTLPACAVEGEHQLAPTPLAQRCVGDGGLELADDLGCTTRREQRVRPVFDQRGMALDPACLLGDPRWPSGSSGCRARGPAPRRSGPPLGWCLRRRRRRGPARGQLVAGGVDLGRAQGPARALRQHEAVAQGATQSGDVGLQGLGGGARRIIAPEQFDERVGRHDRTAVQPEHREDGPRFGAGIATGRPSCRTCRGPKTPSSTV